MKNYFQNNEGRIIPFNKIHNMMFTENTISVSVGFEVFTGEGDPQEIEKIKNDYEEWLQFQLGKDLAAVNQLKSNEMLKQIKTERLCDNAHIPSLKWIIECWESTQQRKFDELGKEDIEDFLYDCLCLLDYAGCLNNKNKGDYMIGDFKNTSSENTNN